MRQLNVNMLARLHTADALLDGKYGVEGSAERKAFDAESQAWYDSQIERSSYHISMPVALHARLSRRATKMGQSISAYVSKVLAQDLQFA